MLPAQLASMKLGCRWTPGSAPPVEMVSAPASPPPDAWGRLDAPRVSGNNNTIGDCVETTAANAVQTAMARAGNFGPIANRYVQGVYSAVTGYVPGNPATDLGTDPAQMFSWWKEKPVGAYRLVKATSLPVANHEARRAIISRSGGVMLVMGLATEQQNQRVWMPAGTPGSWGYHAVWCDSYTGGLTFATSWGAVMPIDETYFTAPGFVEAVFALDLERVT